MQEDNKYILDQLPEGSKLNGIRKRGQLRHVKGIPDGMLYVLDGVTGAFTPEYLNERGLTTRDNVAYVSYRDRVTRRLKLDLVKLPALPIKSLLRIK